MSSPELRYLEDLHLSWIATTYGSGFLEALRKAEINFLKDPRNPTWQRSRQILDDALGVEGLSLEDMPEVARMLPTENDWTTFEKDLLGEYSRYESPLFAYMINPARRVATLGTQAAVQAVVKRSADKFIGDRLTERLNRIAFGSLPDMSFNASAVRVPNADGYVILLNRGLPKFLARIARIVVRVGASVPRDQFAALNFESEDWPRSYERLLLGVVAQSQNFYLLECFAAAVADYYGLAVGLHYDHTLFAGPDRFLSEVMIVGAEAFVIAHEFNHILDGHHVQWSISKGLRGQESVSYGVRDSRMENAADIAGLGALVLSTKLMKDGLLPDDVYQHWLLKGPQLFFLCCSLLESLSSEFGPKVVALEKHPPTIERIGILQHLLEQIDSDHEVGFMRTAYVFKVLSERGLPVLFSAINA